MNNKFKPNKKPPFAKQTEATKLKYIQFVLLID